nr:hypothetical protein [uncultured archaeon]
MKLLEKPLKVTPRGMHGEYNAIIKSYEAYPAINLPNGLFKESIQNSTGASKHKNGLTTMVFQNVIKGGKKCLSITDTNTVGLTGKVTNLDEIEKLVEKYGDKVNEKIEKTENYARFLADNLTHIGDAKFGAGANGKGKMLYQACSVNRTIYVFTIIEVNGKLECRAFEKNLGKQSVEPYEGKEAEEFFKKKTGNRVSLINTTGTMIFIENVNEEVWNSIENSFSILSEQTIKNSANCIIQFDWHLKLGSGTLFIDLINSKEEIKRVKLEGVFEEIENALSGRSGKNEGVEKETYTGEINHYNKKGIVNVTFIKLSQTINNGDIMDVFAYRKGMRIGKFGSGRFLNFPEELRGKILAIVTFDEEADKMVIGAENSNHYGFSTEKIVISKSMSHVENFEQKFLKLIGFERKSENIISTDIKNMIMDMISERLNGRDKVSGKEENILSPYSLTLPSLKTTSGNDRVDRGDNIDLKTIITNDSNADKDVFIRLKAEWKTDAGDIDFSTLYTSKKLTVKSKSSLPWDFDICFIVEMPAGKFQLKAELIDDSNKQPLNAVGYRTLFYNMDVPKTYKRPPHLVEIAGEIKFPNKSTLRVEKGQEIKNVKFKLKNKTHNKLELKITFSLLDCDDVEIFMSKQKNIILNSLGEDSWSVGSIKIDEKFDYIFIKDFKREDRTCKIVVNVETAKPCLKLQIDESENLNCFRKSFYCGIDSDSKNKFSDFLPSDFKTLGTRKSGVLENPDGSYTLLYNNSHSSTKIIQSKSKQYKDGSIFAFYIAELAFEEVAIMSKVANDFIGEYHGYGARFENAGNDPNEIVKTMKDYRDELSFGSK